ncbi:FxSxx-COOH system tetratricopeptide repeat protein [Streptomyces sp. NPDC090088]|uniref:FxSxx-COOH system tetratricopeptide repeat protein n=1 Tax=Streptomyces sp. NPDC090088 TaxID=3365944 RepID=UPI0038151938
MTASRDGRVITFYSYKGGTGRTMALANTAWILAANGRRVLAVDWDLEAAGLHSFFRPFLDPGALTATGGVVNILQDYAWAATDGTTRTGPWHLEFADVEQHAVSVAPERQGLGFENGGSLDFLSAGRRFRAYSGMASSLEWDNFYDRLGGGLFLEALRDSMKRSYDYVLIDSRTGQSDTADICTLQLPDVLVDCFTLSDQSIEGAAEVAHSVGDEHRARRIRVLPVPMRVDESDRRKVEAGRALARVRFAGLPTGPGGERLSAEELTAYWDGVEIPYKAYYAYEETLAVVGDRKGDPKSLLSAYERLTAFVSDHEITALPQIPEPVQLRGRDAFIRRLPRTTAPRVVIAYVPEDRLWADWIESLVQRADGTGTLHDLTTAPLDRVDPGTFALVLTSRALFRSPGIEHVRHLPFDRDGRRGAVIPVRIDEVRLPDAYLGQADPVDLNGLDQAACESALLRALELPGQLPKGGTAAPRFPSRDPFCWNVPQRNLTFTGRSRILERLRESLHSGLTAVLPQPQALFGLGGVGKTQIALEYVHRFAGDYDLVWWVPAENVDNVVASLAELGARIGAPGGEDMSLASQETVRMLSQGNPTRRWILVFDNADDPRELAGYLPTTGGGHILITSRNQVWSQLAPALQVDVFRRQESVEHLSRRARGLTPTEADQVAEAVGDLPLAVEQAGAWLAETAVPTGEYLRRLAEETAAVMGINQPADYPETVAATWNISIERLSRRSPASVRLLQLCALLGPEPISAELLYESDELLHDLSSYDASLRDRLLLGRLVREIGRFALANIDQPSNSIQVHRLVQAVIRSQMTEEERSRARHTVHRILSEARPAGEDEPTDDQANWPRFDLIWPHLAASGIRDCTEAEPRSLLVDRVRYLWKRGEFARAQQLAEDLLAHWKEPLGENDAQYLSLRFQLANVLRSQGLYADARELNEDLRERQRRVLGPRHPHTLSTTSGLAADMAALGRYVEAVELAREAHDGFNDIFDEAHPRTLKAANNHALALRMVGKYDDARRIDEANLARRVRIHGPDHIYTLSSAENLGRDLRETGRYTDSVALLSRTYEQYKRALGKGFPGTLRCAKSLALSLRRVGELADARRLTSATLEQYRAQYTVPTPGGLACELNLAADLFAAEDREAARDLAQQVLAEYMRNPGPAHPHTQAAMNNLGIYQWGCDAVEQAGEVFRQALERMTETLGAHHPHTHFCSANFANVLADSDRPEEAWELERRSADALRTHLGPLHPETLAVLGNGALTLEALGRQDEARGRHEEAVRGLTGQRDQLGENNGITRFVLEGRRVYRDLEPLTL